MEGAAILAAAAEIFRASATGRGHVGCPIPDNAGAADPLVPRGSGYPSRPEMHTMNDMQPPLTDTQLNLIYSQSDKMTAQEIGKSVGLKARIVSIACGKMGVRPLRHSLKFVPKPRVAAN